MITSSFLSVQTLRKHISRSDKSVVALDDFSLSVADGEFVSIVGLSGCGKSTFLHMLGGFEPADGRSMVLNGKPVVAPGLDRGMLFQEYALYPWPTVESKYLVPARDPARCESGTIGNGRAIDGTRRARSIQGSLPERAFGGDEATRCICAIESSG